MHSRSSNREKSTEGQKKKGSSVCYEANSEEDESKTLTSELDSVYINFIKNYIEFETHNDNCLLRMLRG